MHLFVFYRYISIFQNTERAVFKLFKVSIIGNAEYIQSLKGLSLKDAVDCAQFYAHIG